MADPEEIYLGPEINSDPDDWDEGRQWCQDDVWGGEGVKYIRADLVKPQQTQETGK